MVLCQMPTSHYLFVGSLFFVYIATIFLLAGVALGAASVLFTLGIFHSSRVQ